MKIHSLCIVKNEDDVIEETLIKATRWSDFIYIFDNGSTDLTWKKVLNLSQKYSQIIPFKQDGCTFDDSLRLQIFNEYKQRFSSGDWICRLDADEIYIDNPRLFLAKIPPKYDIVLATMFTYYFTDKDFKKYAKNTDLYLNKISVEDRCKYYQNNELEIRFFKYDQNLIWLQRKECLIKSDYRDWPRGLKNVFPIKIWLKNYRYRSPSQIQKRIDLRRKLTKKGLFPQEMKYQWKEIVSNVGRESDFWSWKSRIADSSKLNFDFGDFKYVLREDLTLDIDEILSGYDIKVNSNNFFRYFLGRPIKRKLVRMGILPYPYN